MKSECSVCQKKMTRMSGRWSSDPDPDYPCVSGEAARHCGYRAPARKERERHHRQTNVSRVVIIQLECARFGMKSGKKSKDARVCKELHISFKEDFSKEDRLAHAKLWPLVQEARRRGKCAYLKEGYALIDNKRVDPD